MLRAVYLFIIGIIVFYRLDLTSAEPKILWEKEIEPQLFSSANLPELYEIGGKLALVHYGRLTDTGKQNAKIIIIDKKGNIINTLFIARDFHLKAEGIIHEGDNYRISLRQGLNNFRLFSVLLGPDGNVIDEKRDSNSKTYNYGNGNWHNDSLYFIDNRNNSVIDVYDKDMKLIRTYAYDTSGIPFDIYFRAPTAVTFTSDGNMVTAFPCSKSKKGAEYEYSAVVKSDKNGNIIRTKKFAVADWTGTYLGAIHERIDGGFLAAGGVADSMWYYSAYLARFDKDFNLINSFVFPYEKYTLYADYNVHLDSGRKIAFFGQYFKKGEYLTKYFWLSLFNENCQLIANYKWGGFSECNIDCVADGENGSVILYGRKNKSIYIACIEPEYTTVNESGAVTTLRILPNPANGCVIIENTDKYSAYGCTALSITGLPACTFTVEPGERKVIGVSGWVPGVYFLQARNGGSSFVIKFVIGK